MKNYCPISPLRIPSNILENIIYDKTLKHFLDNGLISPKESEYRPCDSCVNLLLSITHDIFISFDHGSEVRGVFLDFSKAFDKVRLDRIIYKLNPSSTKDKLICLLMVSSHYGQRQIKAFNMNQFWDLFYF